MVVFEKCNIATRPKGAKCKSEAEIEAWMGFKYLFLTINEARFIPHKFGEDRIEKKASLNWYALNYKSRTDVPLIITRSELHFGDSIFNVGGLLDEKENAYFVENSQNRLLPYNNNIQNAITFEISLTERSLIRTVYTFLDLLKDIGGLFGALAPLCTMLVALF